MGPFSHKDRRGDQMARIVTTCYPITMRLTMTPEKRKSKGFADKVQAGVETVSEKPGPLPAKVLPSGPRSAILTAQWRERRKAVLLNPKGMPRLSLALLIQESRK
jgi:hypothetical protein